MWAELVALAQQTPPVVVTPAEGLQVVEGVTTSQIIAIGAAVASMIAALGSAVAAILGVWLQNRSTTKAVKSIDAATAQAVENGAKSDAVLEKTGKIQTSVDGQLSKTLAVVDQLQTRVAEQRDLIEKLLAAQKPPVIMPMAHPPAQPPRGERREDTATREQIAQDTAMIKETTAATLEAIKQIVPPAPAKE